MQFIINVEDIQDKNLAESQNEFNRIYDEYEKAKNFLSEQIQNKLFKEYTHLFTLNPTLKAISWTQYTPYFNDGDECLFSVNSINALSFIPESFEEYYDDYLDEEIEEGKFTKEDFAINFYVKTKDKHLSIQGVNALKAFNDFLQNNQNYMRKIFGEHVHILMTHEGFKVSDYEHE